MTYTLLNTLTNNINYTHNNDGTITVTNLGVQVGIVGVPTGKFIQTELIPTTGVDAFPVIIPANMAASDIPAFLQTESQAYVTKTYPNS
jgi:hypothetical protein